MARASLFHTLRTGVIIATITAVIFIPSAEILLRVFFPQVVMYPRWETSNEYGVVLPRSAVMVHRQPGRWEYRYTINQDGCRGVFVPVADARAMPTVVVLGDSYSMGMGVNDGEEYPAVLVRELGKTYRVINTGNPGWGLTQEIRRYYEFGCKYKPAIVILQFCANDPSDCLRDRVTCVENGRFVFHNTQHRDNPIFKALSHVRLVQASQLYALVRSIYETRRDAAWQTEAQTQSSEESNLYNQLLDVFAHDLYKDHIRFIVISVNGQLGSFPAIKDEVLALHRQGVLEYREVEDWFRGVDDYASPEGHAWGAKAHQIVGENLARVIRGSAIVSH